MSLLDELAVEVDKDGLVIKGVISEFDGFAGQAGADFIFESVVGDEVCFADVAVFSPEKDGLELFFINFSQVWGDVVSPSGVGCFFCGGVLILMIGLFDPGPELVVELMEVVNFFMLEFGEEIGSYGAEESFDFPASFGGVGF